MNFFQVIGEFLQQSVQFFINLYETIVGATTLLDPFTGWLGVPFIGQMIFTLAGLAVFFIVIDLIRDLL